jgi:hypothetical protein
VEEHDFIQSRRAAKEMLIDLPAPFFPRIGAEDVVEPKVWSLLWQIRRRVRAGLGICRDVVPYEQMVQPIGRYYHPSFPKPIDRTAKFSIEFDRGVKQESAFY